jgi:protein LSM14
LYSINEENATVALHNVKSFGTEGREGNAIEPSDAVHQFLLFRGQDIQDLHVHEEQQTDPVVEPPTAEEQALEIVPKQEKQPDPQQVGSPPKEVTGTPLKNDQTPNVPKRQTPKAKNPNQNANNNTHTNTRKSNNNAAVGTGASLLHRKERGTVPAATQETARADFDFQSNLENFRESSTVVAATGYDKDDFFDSISCDALDKQSGVDNRLRGSTERQLNTEVSVSKSFCIAHELWNSYLLIFL